MSPRHILLLQMKMVKILLRSQTCNKAQKPKISPNYLFHVLEEPAKNGTFLTCYIPFYLFYLLHSPKILSQPNSLKEQNKNQTKNHDVKKNFSFLFLIEI